MRLLAHGLVALACAFGATTFLSPHAEAKTASATRLVAQTLQPSRGLAKIPRTHNLRRPLFRRPIGIAAAPARDLKPRRAHAPAICVSLASLRRIQNLAPASASIEELEIELALSDALLDDPARRLVLPEVTVTEAFLFELPSRSREPIVPAETDRPSEAKEMLRLHPRLFDSGDDSAAAG